jgi:large subunit ribosomal protein L25
MARRISIKAEAREALGRNKVNKVRTQGRVPAVLYGNNQAARPLQVPAEDLLKVVQGEGYESVLIDLEIAGDKDGVKHLALMHGLQVHPIRDKVLHVDFHEIDPAKPLQTEVPVHPVGEPLGVKMGGVLDHLLRHVRIECLPKNLPGELRVSVVGLDMNQAIHVGDIKLPEGVKMITPLELPIFMVHVTKATTAEEAVQSPGGTEAAAPGPVAPETSTPAAAES